MGDLREVRRLVAEVEAPSPEPEPLYPLASSVDASSASAAAAALFPEKGTLRLRGGGEGGRTFTRRGNRGSDRDRRSRPTAAERGLLKRQGAEQPTRSCRNRASDHDTP